MTKHKLRMTIPPSVNSIWARGKHGSYLTGKYRAWLDANSASVKCQYHGGEPVTLCHIHIQIYGGPGFRKGRDISNCEKAIGDLLVRTKILEDDNHSVLQKLVLEYMGVAPNAGNAFVDVVISVLNENERKV